MASLSFDIYLRATPGQVRKALTDPALAISRRFGVSFRTDAGAASPSGGWPEDDEETTPRSVPGQRLAFEWLQTENLGANGGRPSVVLIELVAMGEVTRLSVWHRDLAPDGSFLKAVAPGWPMMLSSLKSLVETGQPLTFGTGT
jgi:uncharacterized protein YndB with AHSA1/START domain